MNDRGARTILILIAFFFLGYALASRVQRLSGYLFSDEAVYLMMAQSIAFDGDIEYTRVDLERIYSDYHEGPHGLYLKKGLHPDIELGGDFPYVHAVGAASGKLYYGKSYIQPFLAAPFVRIFGDNGFAVFHALLLTLMLLAGYSYVRRFNEAGRSLAFTATFLIAGVAVVYLFWLTADFFNTASVFLAYFLWLYKHAPASRRSIFDSLWTDYAAALVLAMATFSKPTNILLIAPIVIHAWSRRRWLHGLLIGLLFGSVLASLFYVNALATGDINYQGGERKIFYYRYPFLHEKATFNTTGSAMSTNEWSFPFSWRVFLTNIFFYFFGRFAGVFVYFPGTLIALYYFFRSRRDLVRWLVFGAAATEILFFILTFPNDYQGGGAGCLGNRYFLSIFPLFFFLAAELPSVKPLILGWVHTGLFLSQILLNPYRSSFDPGLHASKYPFKWLPVELSLLQKLPCNNSPNASQIPFGGSPPRFKLYFIDENFHRKEAEPYEGFWTYGDRESEIVLQSYSPLKKLAVRLRGGPVATEVVVKLGPFSSRTARLEAGETSVVFEPVRGYPYPGPSYLYHLKIRAREGFVPGFASPESSDTRFLGCYVGFEIE